MTASIPNPVQSAALARPHHPALEATEGTLTALELVARVRRLAGGLAAQGVAAGQIVALSGAFGVDFVVALHALGWLGATVAPMSARLTEGERAEALVGSGATAGLFLDGSAGAGIQVLSWEEGDEAPERFWPLEEVRLVVMTSGTTGAPKAVALTTLQLMTSAFGSITRLGHLPDDRWLACLPLNHVGGLSILYRCAWYGTTAALHPRFDAGAVAEALDSGAVSLVSLVPTMLDQVLDARPAEPFPAALRCILLGGGATPERLLERCQAIGAPVSVTWGMTEAASQICTRQPGDLRLEAGVGAPLPFARVDNGPEGRLRVRGPVVGGGELLSADRGVVEDDGAIHVEGRADDVIISGGENIAPAEVERVLESHPGVAEAVVFGVPDEVWGHRPVAALVGRAGAASPTLDEIRGWCAARLAPFKVPDRVEWLDHMPRGAMGKLSRRRVREAIEERSSWKPSEGSAPREEAR